MVTALTEIETRRRVRKQAGDGRFGADVWHVTQHVMHLPVSMRG